FLGQRGIGAESDFRPACVTPDGHSDAEVLHVGLGGNVEPRVGRYGLVEVDNAAGDFEAHAGEGIEALARHDARLAANTRAVGRPAQDDVGAPRAAGAPAVARL